MLIQNFGEVACVTLIKCLDNFDKEGLNDWKWKRRTKEKIKRKKKKEIV